MNITKINNFDLTALCELNTQKYPFLLESVTHNDNNKYSILFAYPQKTIYCKNYKDDFLNELESSINKTSGIKNSHNLPFMGGYFLYFAYEFIAKLESCVKIKTDNLLLAQAVYIPVAIIKNHITNITYIIDEDMNSIRTNEIIFDVKNIKNTETNCENFEHTISVDDGNKFIQSVDIAKQYIKNGDIFQANLSREWQINLSKEVKDICVYRKLKIKNPSPFAAFVKLDNFTIISSSPERLFSVDSEIIQTRPIAGTRPISDDMDKNNLLKQELKNNLKEQAEHLMLLDLERNDLGRVCEYGSVEVNETMTIESYKFVHHIVSNIKGRLRKNWKFSDIITALFPGGTITGCPKIRSIQIIAELENESRGSYTGSVGYISNCGKMDFNILIRTMIKNKNKISFRAGAGIVFDSVAKSELIETSHKAKGMLAVFE